MELTDNSSLPEKNGRHSTAHFLKCILVSENFCVLIQISLKFVHKDPIDNNPASFQVMTWCWTGDKPLQEPMLTQFTDTDMQH